MEKDRCRWGVFIIILIGISGCCHAFVKETDLFPFDVRSDNKFTPGGSSKQFDWSVPFPCFNISFVGIMFNSRGGFVFKRALRPMPVSYCIIYFFEGEGWWMDSSRSQILYRESMDRTLLRKAARDVGKAFPEFRGITLSWMFIITWKDIPFYGCNSPDLYENIAQQVFTTDGHHSFAIMYYNIDERTSKVDCNDRKVLLSGSCDFKIANLRGSNIGEPGKWVLRVDSDLKKANCEEFQEFKNKLRTTPSVVSFGRRVPLRLEGPCLNQNYKYNCVFEDYNLNGDLVKVDSVAWQSMDMKSVICLMPHLNRAGRIKVRLAIDNNEDPDIKFSYPGYIYSVRNDGDKDQFQFKLNHGPENDTLFVEASWDPTFFQREVELEKEILGNDGHDDDSKPSLEEQPMDVIVETFDGLSWESQGSLLRGIKNTGEFNGTLDNTAIELLHKIIFIDDPEFLSIHLQRSNQEGEDRKKREVGRGGSIRSKLGANDRDTAKFVEKLLGKDLAKYGQKKCDEWYNADRLIPLPTDTIPCPPNVEMARLDSNFEPDAAANWKLSFNFYHPGGDRGFRQRNLAQSGGGSQCVYDKGGRLMVGPPGGGTLDRYSPSSNFLMHQVHDVMPYIFCCKWSGHLNKENCASKYYAQRPSHDGRNYSGPRVTRAVGDPHITTFDGLSYTFNGVGEFYMVSLEDENVTFEMQARMEQYITPENVPMKASVFTAAVMQEKRGDTEITIQVSYEDGQIAVTLDGENIDLSDNVPQSFTVSHKSSSVTFENSTHVVVTFSSGFSFTFSTVGPNEVALNIFGMTSNVYGLCKGLLGNNDGIMENDLETPDGTQLEWNSSSETIHYDFGLKWRVPQKSSIFKYPFGKSYQDYNKPQFKPNFPNEKDVQTVRQSIKDSCNNQKDCIFDYITTGSQVLATGTKEVNEKVEAALITFSKPIQMCPSVKSPENGFVLMTNMNIGGTLSFHCLTGYQLSNCVENCTCLENPDSIEDDPKWSCSSGELEEVIVECEKESNNVEKCKTPLKNGGGSVSNEQRNYSVLIIIFTIPSLWLTIKAMSK